LFKDVENLASKQIFARWQAILSIFYFNIEYIKGESNSIPDFLTREFLHKSSPSSSKTKTNTPPRSANPKTQTSQFSSTNLTLSNRFSNKFTNLAEFPPLPSKLPTYAQTVTASSLKSLASSNNSSSNSQTQVNSPSQVNPKTQVNSPS
jgi:hypothetical protein